MKVKEKTTTFEAMQISLSTISDLRIFDTTIIGINLENIRGDDWEVKLHKTTPPTTSSVQESYYLNIYMGWWQVRQGRGLVDYVSDEQFREKYEEVK